MTGKSKATTSENEISLKELLLHVLQAVHFLFRKWKWILLFTLIGMLAGLSYAFLITPVYKASISFVTDTDQNASSGMSSYAGLAAQFGVNLDQSNLGNVLFSGDNIYDLMKTRRMLQNTLLTPVVIHNKKTLLIDEYIEMEGLRKKWKDQPHYRNLSFDIDTSKYTIYQNAAITTICKAIVAKNLDFPSESGERGSSSIMAVDFISKSEQFSLFFLTNLIDNVAQFYVATKTKKARSNLSVLNKQLDSVRTQLYGAMSNVASFQDNNLNLVKQGPRVQQQKTSLRMDVNSAIYQQLVSAVETAKMNLQRETPLFEIIDSPVLPLHKKRPNMIIWGMLGAFLGIFLSITWLLSRRFYEHVMAEE